MKLNNKGINEQFGDYFNQHFFSLGSYNGLADPNLYNFFASPKRRNLLIKQGLVFYIQVSVNGTVRDRYSETPVILKEKKYGLPYEQSATPVPKPKKSRRKNKSSDMNYDNFNLKKKLLPPIKPIFSSEFKRIIRRRKKVINELIKNLRNDN